MSRPPRPRTQWSTSGVPDADARSIDYLPLEHADLVALQRDLAGEVPGLSQPDAEGDFASTLMELSALAGHVLGLYQDRYAGEAFLSTARSPRSLVRHGRRLGYEPAPAVAATGYVCLVAKGAAGRVEAGFGLSSSPTRGGTPQDYETLEDVEVDPAHNALIPRDAYVPWGDTRPEFLELPGLGLGLLPGEPLAIDGGGGGLYACTVSRTVEVPQRRVTRLWTNPPLPVLPEADQVVLYARPKTRAHLFGVLVPAPDVTDSDLQSGVQNPEVPPVGGAPTVGWRVSPSYSAHELYLSEELKAIDAVGPAVRVVGGGSTVFRVEGTRPVHVTFQKVSRVDITTPAITIPMPAPAPVGASGDTEGIITPPPPPPPPPPIVIPGTVTHTTQTVTMSRAVTSLALQTRSSGSEDAWRERQDPRASVWLLGWRMQLVVPWTRPNPASARGTLELSGAHRGLAAGMLIALSPAPDVEVAPLLPDRPVAEIARLTEVRIDASAGPTRIAWRVLDPAVESRDWLVGELSVSANVAPVSHGRSVTEALGESDGMTAFLRFTLRHAPVTHLPATEGAEPALEVRVDGLRWERVIDFEDSGPHDRHYVVQRDEAGALTVMFGDGARGAVPPSGRRNITARYRVGGGAVGNAPREGVSQIRKSHPLVERAYNPRAITGGVDAAQADDVRAHATRHLRTFDRAVSVADHADLALRFPGVVRARATWTMLPGQDVEGVLVVVADTEGNAPDLDLERSGFLRFMNARRDVSIPMEAIGPSPVPLYARIEVGIDGAAEREQVLRAVQDALYGRRPEAPGLFSFAGREVGQPAFLSEVYARVERVPGVSTVRVVHLSTAPESEAGARANDAIAVRPDEWLSLEPANLTLTALENPR